MSKNNLCLTSLVAAIQYHHAPLEAGEHSKIATVVAMAAEISLRLDRDQPAIAANGEGVPDSPLYEDLAKLRDIVADMTRDFTDKVYAEANRLVS